MYEREDFQESIADVAQSALLRLRNLRENLGNVSELDKSDIVYERITANSDLAEDGDYTQETTLELFTNVFDEIHNNLMLEDEAAEYFSDTVAKLIETGIQDREEDAGNTLTQLVPDINALRSHITMVWQDQTAQRFSQQEIVIYRFHSMGCKVQIKFIYDSSNGYWNLGYGTQVHRLLFHWGKNIHEVEDGIIHLDPINGEDKLTSFE